MSQAIPTQFAHNQVAPIFSIRDVAENGKSIMRCSRCEGLPEEDRGKSFQLVPGAITKAKEHIAVCCSEIRPGVSSADANLRHTLLINMSGKHVASMSKKAQVLRKFQLPNMTKSGYVTIALIN